MVPALDPHEPSIFTWIADSQLGVDLMLSSLILSAAIQAAQLSTTPTTSETQLQSATKTCPDGSVVLPSDQCVAVPDHRTQFSLPPPDMTLTTEWSCGKPGMPSEAKVRITDKPIVSEHGEQLWKTIFDIKLLSLHIGGGPASIEDLQRVKEALGSFDQISILQGKCFQAQPALLIKGFKWDGQKHHEQSVQIEL